MKMKPVSSPEVKEPPPRTWSNCKVCGDHVYISGMVAQDAGGGMYEQARQVFGKIKHLIEAAGGRMNDVVKVNVYVTDIAEREEVWRARAEFFTGAFPCSTLVEVSALARPGLKVEVEAEGFLGAGTD